MIKILILVLLSSCALQRRSSLEMTAKQVAEDKKVLLYALYNAYSGNYFAPGIDLKDHYKKLKMERNDISKKEFFSLIENYFHLLPDKTIKIRKEPFRKENIFSQFSFDSTEIARQKFTVLKINSLKLNDDNTFTTIKNKISKSRNLIVDLRNIVGEHDTLGIRLARYLNGGVLKHPIIRQHHIRTKEATRLLTNYYKFHHPKLDYPFPPYKKGEAKVLPIEFRRDTTAYSDKYSPNIKTYFLVSEKCRKSCETTLLALERNPNVTIVGTKTSGEIHFGHEGLLMLPNSGFFVYIPTSYSEFADGRFLEKKGITPQINCQTKQILSDTIAIQLCDNYYSAQ